MSWFIADSLSKHFYREDMADSSMYFSELALTLTDQKDDSLLTLIRRVPIHYGRYSNYDRADSLIQVLSPVIESRDKKDILEAEWYYKLADFYQSKAVYDTSIVLCKKSIALYNNSSPIDSYRVCDAYNVMAICYELLGQHDLAFSTYDTAMIYGENLAGQVSSLYTNPLFNKHILYFKVGERTKALQGCYHALELRKKFLPPAHDHIMANYNVIGQIYFYSGQYLKSISTFNSALELASSQSPPSEYHTASFERLLGIVYEALGNYERSGRYFKRSIEKFKNIFGEENARYAEYFMSLGIHYIKTEQYDLAQETFNDVTPTLEKFLGANNIKTWQAKSNLAMALSYQSNYTASDSLVNAILTSIDTTLGKDYADYDDYLIIRAQNYLKWGKIDKGIQDLIPVFEKRKEKLGSSHSKTLDTQFDLAYAYGLNGQINKADDLFTDGIHVSLKVFNQTLSYLTEKEVFDYFDVLTQRLNKFHQHVLLTNSPNSLALAAHLSRNIKRLSTESTQSKVARIFERYSDSETIKQLYQEWSTQKSKLTKSVAAGHPIESLDDQLDKIEDIERNIWQQIQESRPQADFVSTEDILSALNANDIFIDFYALNSESEELILPILYLPDHKEVKFGDLISVNEITSLIQKYPNDYHSKVYQDLIPCLNLSNNEKGNLLLSPTSILNHFDFNSIKSDSLYLMDDFLSIRHFISSRSLISNKNVASPRFDFIDLYGGAIYQVDAKHLKSFKKHDTAAPLENNNQMYASLADQNRFVNDHQAEALHYLPATQTEVMVIDSISKSRNLPTITHLDLNMREDQFKLRPKENFRDGILHIGTHGYYFDITNTWSQFFNSGLYFTGAANSLQGDTAIQSLTQEDGILSAYEVSHSDLSRYHLVVLSSCNSGLGANHGNQGVVGIQSAFLSAGAKGLLMSQSEISDQITLEFMTVFYKELLRGKAPHEALKHAKKELRDEYDDSYWATYYLIE